MPQYLNRRIDTKIGRLNAPIAQLGAPKGAESRTLLRSRLRVQIPLGAPTREVVRVGEPNPICKIDVPGTNKSIVSNSREIRGLAILALGSQIVRLSGLRYKVRSQSGNGSYVVIMNNFHEWECECPDFSFRHVVCKHIHAVKFSLNLRDRITSLSLGVSSNAFVVCKRCGSDKLVKNSVRHNRSGSVQRYSCKACGYRFSNNIGFERMKHDPKAITAALDLYFKGVSQRKIVHHLKQFYDVKVTQPCIVKWLRKYVSLVREYVDQLVPQTSGFVHVDEMKVNVNGRLDWLWNLMDDDTRFWVSSLISQRREVADARATFQDAKRKLKVTPIAVTHDGLQSYGEAFRNEFYTQTTPRPIEVRSVSIRERGLNNRMERLNQTFRDRNKTQRGLDHEESAQLMADGTRIEYNFIRPHMALNGKTPAEAVGIDLGLGGNKWETLIREATKCEIAQKHRR